MIVKEVNVFPQAKSQDHGNQGSTTIRFKKQYIQQHNTTQHNTTQHNTTQHTTNAQT